MTSYSVKFWNRFAERYARMPVQDEAVYQRKLSVTQEYFPPDADVLEFGCGTGTTAIHHAPHVKRYRAIDVSPKMIGIAERKAAAEPMDNLSFTVSALEEYPVDDASLDAVLGMSILHLLDDPEDAIKRVYRMLRPGGVFVSSTACLGDTMKYFKLIGPVGSFFGLMPRVQVFTRSHLVDSLIRSGFDIDHQWQPAKGKGVFIIARKPLDSGASITA